MAFTFAGLMGEADIERSTFASRFFLLVHEEKVWWDLGI